MPILSKALPSIADLSRIYATHRPLVQRGITAGFVLYVLLAAYQNVAARPPTKDIKNVPARDGKPPRVAVSISYSVRLLSLNLTLCSPCRSMHCFISA